MNQLIATTSAQKLTPRLQHEEIRETRSLPFSSRKEKGHRNAAPEDLIYGVGIVDWRIFYLFIKILTLETLNAFQFSMDPIQILTMALY